MAIFKKNTGALCLAALMIMATVLSSSVAEEIGRTAIVAVSKARGMELAGAIDSQCIGQDAGELSGMEEALEIPVLNDLTMVLGSIAQSRATGVVADFSEPSIVYDNVKQAIRADGNSKSSHEIGMELSKWSAAAGLRPIGAVVFMQRGILKICLRTTDSTTNTAEIAKGIRIFATCRISLDAKWTSAGTTSELTTLIQTGKKPTYCSDKGSCCCPQNRR